MTSCVQVLYIAQHFSRLFFSFRTAAVKGISEMDTAPVTQNGAPANKKTSASLPELEFREKGKGGGEAKKQHNSILPSSVDSKLQEMEYMENHINNKRLTTELGSTENLLLKEDNSSCSSSSSSCSKNYKNASNSSTLNSSPRGHSATNGSVPTSAQSSSSSTGKTEKKKVAVGKGTVGGSHRDPTDNCIPNNQLSKPEALVR